MVVAKKTDKNRVWKRRGCIRTLMFASSLCTTPTSQSHPSRAHMRASNIDSRVQCCNSGGGGWGVGEGSREGRGVEPPEKWRAPSSNSGSTHLPRSCSPAPLGLSTTPSWSASQSLELIPHLGHTSQRHVVCECRHNKHTPWPAVVKILLSSGVWHQVVWWNSWRIKDQLDDTCYFISLILCSTCFGH